MSDRPDPPQKLADRLAAVGLDWGATTWRIVREDRLLAVAYVALAISALVPLARTMFLPLVDLGSNVGAAGMIPHWLAGESVARHHYTLNPIPTPYWTAYAIMSLSSWAAGPVVAHKVIVALDVLLLPLAAVRLAHALGRDPRVGLLAFALVWDENLYWGWVSFALGMPLGLFALARLIDARTVREALRVVQLSLLVALTHIHAVVMLVVVGVGVAIAGAIVGRSLLAGLARAAVGLSGTGVVMLPWLSQRFLPQASRDAGVTPLSMGFPPFDERIANLYQASLHVVPTTQGVRVTTATFFVLLGTALCLAALPSVRVSPRRDAAAAAALLGVAGLYLLLPFDVSGPVTHWWTYPRYATYTLLIALLVARPRLEGVRLLALGPAAAMTVALHLEVGEQFASFHERAAPYAEIVAAMQPNKTFLPLDFQTADPLLRHAPFGQLHGFAAAAKGNYDPHLFDEVNNPLLFRHENMLPCPSWRAQQEFTLDAHGKHYDYIVVRGLGDDPLRGGVKAGGVAAKLVKEAGEWRLYEVQRVGG